MYRRKGGAIAGEKVVAAETLQEFLIGYALISEPREEYMGDVSRFKKLQNKFMLDGNSAKRRKLACPELA